MKKDVDIVKIISFLTFDGHLMKDLSGFYFCSRDIDVLNYFKKIMNDKFNITGKLEKGQGYGESYKLRCFNTIMSKKLFSMGAPKGNKVLTSFSVPSWIKQNKDFIRVYLQTALDCEGSIWQEPNRFCIRFGICKDNELLDDGISFIQELKDMFKELSIETTRSWLAPANIRKDGKITISILFKIKQKSLCRFAKEVGFNDKFKKQRLNLMLEAMSSPARDP